MSDHENEFDKEFFQGLFYGGNIVMFLGFAWIFYLNFSDNFHSNWMAIAVFTIILGSCLALGSGLMRPITVIAFVTWWVTCNWLVQLTTS